MEQVSEWTGGVLCMNNGTLVSEYRIVPYTRTYEHSTLFLYFVCFYIWNIYSHIFILIPEQIIIILEYVNACSKYKNI